MADRDIPKGTDCQSAIVGPLDLTQLPRRPWTEGLRDTPDGESVP